jgi:uncharacterized protein (DUF697 family)
MTALRDALAERRIPLVVVIIAGGPQTAAVPQPKETGRVMVPSLGRAAADAIAGGLLGAVDPARQLAFARQLPALRPSLATRLIDEASRANAAYAFSAGVAETIPILTAPLNVADMIVLAKNQAVMAYKLALIAGRDGTPREIVSELAGVLGGGLLFRQAARQLVGLVPVIGLASKVAVAYAGTWTIGRAVEMWAMEGRTPSAAAARRFYAEGLERGKRGAKSIMARANRPGTPLDRLRARFARRRRDGG